VPSAFDADLTGVMEVIPSAYVGTRPKIVVLLDEVERLLPTRSGTSWFRGLFEFLSYFRGVSQRTANITMIVTAANPAIQETAQCDGRDNPVFGFFLELYLQMFEATECRSMIRSLGKGMGLTFPTETCSLIYALTGGHPFITRQFCSYLAEIYPDRPLDLQPAMVDAQLDQYLDLRADKDFDEIFQRLSRDFPQELDVCLALARSAEPLKLKQLTQEGKEAKMSLRHLIGYQIVRIHESTVSLSMDLMKRWLQLGYAKDPQ
jgi:hypothetical protein